MNSQQMRDFDYLHYLQTVLRSESTQALYIATEKDFDREQGIPFPYRSYFYAFGVVHEGERRFRIGFREFQLKERSLTIVGPGILRCWLDQNWSVKTTTLFFTPALFQQTSHTQALVKYKFFQPNAQHVLDLTEEQYQGFIRFTQLLEHHRHNQAICGGVVFALLEYIAELYPVLSANESEMHAHYVLVQTFSQLLHHHFREQKAVAFYASEMGISAKHLSEILRQVVGQSAKQIISDYVLMEAQSLLKQTSLNVQEIVYQLGYTDPSYFNKMFKQKLGVTPLHYRNRTV